MAVFNISFLEMERLQSFLVNIMKLVIRIFIIFCMLNLEVLSINVKVDKGKEVILIYLSVYNESLEYDHFE